MKQNPELDAQSQPPYGYEGKRFFKALVCRLKSVIGMMMNSNGEVNQSTWGQELRLPVESREHLQKAIRNASIICNKEQDLFHWYYGYKQNA